MRFLALPDLESILREQVEREVTDANVATSVPRAEKFNEFLPFVIVKQIGSTPVGEGRRYQEAMIQVEAWAMTRFEAWSLVEQTRLAISEMEGSRFDQDGGYPDGAFISRIVTSDYRSLPDPNTGRDRYLLTLMITYAAAPGSESS